MKDAIRVAWNTVVAIVIIFMMIIPCFFAMVAAFALCVGALIVAVGLFVFIFVCLWIGAKLTNRDEEAEFLLAKAKGLLSSDTDESIE